MHCVDLGGSFPTSIYLQKSASIQPRTSLFNFSNFNPALVISFSLSSPGPLRLTRRAVGMKNKKTSRLLQGLPKSCRNTAFRASGFLQINFRIGCPASTYFRPRLGGTRSLRRSGLGRWDCNMKLIEMSFCSDRGGLSGN